MNDLIEFLRAQLDDDERVAKGDAPGHQQWHTEACGYDLFEGLADECRCGVPVRVLAEVDAKRRILDEAIRLMSYDGEFQFVELLALPYADREGYRSEWAP